jgi:hypothetical protein
MNAGTFLAIVMAVGILGFIFLIAGLSIRPKRAQRHATPDTAAGKMSAGAGHIAADASHDASAARRDDRRR